MKLAMILILAATLAACSSNESSTKTASKEGPSASEHRWWAESQWIRKSAGADRDSQQLHINRVSSLVDEGWFVISQGDAGTMLVR